MAVGFTGNIVGEPRNAARVQRCRPPGESRHCQVETAPEKVDGTGLAEKAGAESLEDAVDGHACPEVLRHRLCVVGPLGVASAVAMWLAFLPPQRYVNWVLARAGAGA